jgi:D-alanine-D-alanine ligase
VRENLKKLRIAVLMGGTSGEREVSLRSGKNVLDSLLRQGMDAFAVDVGENPASQLTDEKIDIAFIALHGKRGEDGTIQGLLEMLNIPYTGSGVLASSVAMNKIAAKKILMSSNIPTPAFLLVDVEQDMQSTLEEARAKLEMPVVVKPVSEGSSLGVVIAKSLTELEDAIRKGFFEYGKIFLEKFIAGKEITIGILGTNSKAKALPILELRPKKFFYDFEAKYTKGLTDFILPAELSEELTLKCQGIALETHRTIGCKDMSRVDMRLAPDGTPYVLEINTIPGLTELSDLPAQAKSAGISFDDLILEILKSAFISGNHIRSNGKNNRKNGHSLSLMTSKTEASCFCANVKP